MFERGAVGQLTKGLSNEWMKKGGCVIALAPGYVETELTRGYSEEIGCRRGGGVVRMILWWWSFISLVEAGMLVPLLFGRRIWMDCQVEVSHAGLMSMSDFVGDEIHVVDGGFCGR